jgi:aminopeptidase N
MRTDTPKTIYLKDYRPPSYLIDQVDLRVELGEEGTVVTADLGLHAHEHTPPHTPLILDGEGLETLSVMLNGAELGADAYRIEEDTLIVPDVPQRFWLQTRVLIHPESNTALEGLYKSSSNFCTQCEAEGFRKITWFVDRPDNMSRYTTTIVGDRERYPVMLSNGNPVEEGLLEDGRHWIKWEDPFLKPSYLFALVAGRLEHIEDRFTTASGREVTLRIFTEAHNIEKCDHAMASLKKAMHWDEQVFGREYDLDLYMIVAVDDFNMGAMENKGLNVFNSKYVLASPETATDGDHEGIEGVIAHEYFHNWSGNRVTCRDWFQLSLKEGLTVFRDQEFSADMGSRPVKRIQEVRILRTAQFAEDAGPMAHPVRPQSYMEISNFYTATVYNKGAEVVRMVRTLLGPEGFRKGMDLYFERHDGQAVTTDDFVAAMQDATGVDLAQFKRWYGQAGTPNVAFEGEYDAEANRYSLTLRQSTPPTPGQEEKAPVLIPVRMALLDKSGTAIPLQRPGSEQSGASETVLHFAEAQQRFEFEAVSSEPVVSLFRDFSAPVLLKTGYSDEALAFLLAHDTDTFNRWDAGQQLALRIMHRLIADHEAGRTLVLGEGFVEGVRRTLGDRTLDPALIAEAITLPSERYVGETMREVDVDGIHHVRELIRRVFGTRLFEDLIGTYEHLKATGPYRFDSGDAARRSLKNRCLGYLMNSRSPDAARIALEQFRDADNMTDSLAAVSALADTEGEERELALAEFYGRWSGEPLVIDKWLSVQAMSSLPDTLERVKVLIDHPAFDIRNPNRVRALIGAFAQGNQVRFHAADGSGYVFLTDHILVLDSLNPQVAARLAGAFTRWRRFDAGRQAAMRGQLERLKAHEGLSRDVYEVVSKSLEAKASGKD